MHKESLNGLQFLPLPLHLKTKKEKTKMSTETTNKKIKIDNGTTFGRTYTDKEVDAKLPTDLIASTNKLSLGVGNTALGNGVNLEGFTYDEATKTLKASGGGATLPAGTRDDPFRINESELYAYNNQELVFNSVNRIDIKGDNSYFSLYYYYHNKLRGIDLFNSTDHNIEYYLNYDGPDNYRKIVNVPNENVIGALIQNKDDFNIVKIPTDNTESYYLEGTYDSTTKQSTIAWSALKTTYNHYIVITDGTASNANYLLIPSTNNLICNILTDLDTLLGTEPRFIQASGVVTDTASKLPIVAIKWQGSFSSSKIITTSSEEATTKFTDITDVVEPA